MRDRRTLDASSPAQLHALSQAPPGSRLWLRAERPHGAIISQLAHRLPTNKGNVTHRAGRSSSTPARPGRDGPGRCAVPAPAVLRPRTARRLHVGAGDGGAATVALLQSVADGDRPHRPAAAQPPGAPADPAAGARAGSAPRHPRGAAGARGRSRNVVRRSRQRLSARLTRPAPIGSWSCHQKRGDRDLRCPSARHVPAVGIPGHAARDPGGAGVVPRRSAEPAHLPADGRAPRRGRPRASSSTTPRWRTRSGSPRWC